MQFVGETLPDKKSIGWDHNVRNEKTTYNVIYTKKKLLPRYQRLLPWHSMVNRGRGLSKKFECGSYGMMGKEGGAVVFFLLSLRPMSLISEHRHFVWYFEIKKAVAFLLLLSNGK